MVAGGCPRDRWAMPGEVRGGEGGEGVSAAAAENMCQETSARRGRLALRSCDMSVVWYFVFFYHSFFIKVDISY